MKKLVLFIAVMLMLCLNVIPSFASASLIHEWKFDEISGSIAYDSVGDANGTLINFTDGWTAGVYGNALQFNSSQEQYVDVGNDSSFNFMTDDFSISMWFKTNISVDADLVLFEKGDSDSVSYIFFITDNAFSFMVGDSYQSNVNEILYPDDYHDVGLRNGGWHYVVVSRNSTYLNLYLDGIRVQSTIAELENISFPTWSNISAKIGVLYYHPSDGLYNYFNGTIDEVSIWDGELNQTEVENLYLYNSLNYTNITIPAEPSLLYTILADTGSGLGGFFEAITSPLAYLILVLAMISSIFTIFYVVVTVIKKSFG